MLINKSNVKKLTQAAIEERAKKGGRKFTRIASSYYDAIEAAVRTAVASRVHSAPSIGVTLQ